MANKRIRASMLRDSKETAHEHALLYRMARQGKMPLLDVARYSTILATHRTILESTQTEDRLSKIEEKLERLVSSDNRNVVQFKRQA
jgi:hypothetical protein